MMRTGKAGAGLLLTFAKVITVTRPLSFAHRVAGAAPSGARPRFVLCSGEGLELDPSRRLLGRGESNRLPQSPANGQKRVASRDCMKSLDNAQIRPYELTKVGQRSSIFAVR